MDYDAWLAKAKNVIITKVETGKKFELKGLFPDYEWESLSKGDRSTLGKHFAAEVKEGRFPFVEHCGEGKSHHNQYIKKEHKQ